MFNFYLFRYQEKLRVHSLRVMAVVEKTMHRLDCEDRAAKVNKTNILVIVLELG